MSAISAAAVSSALADVLAASFGPFSGDCVILDDAGQIVITNSGSQVLQALEGSVSSQPFAALVLKSATAFCKANGTLTAK